MEDLLKCPNCGEVLTPVHENNGFTMPEGPEHWEIIGYSCESCGKGFDATDAEELEKISQAIEGGENGK